MKSAAKSEITESPKTPGGISRSLLTPCRRVGLSRNWRKSGIAPFQSPMISSCNEVQREDVGVVRKGNECSSDKVATQKRSTDYETSTGVRTPTRSVGLPQRKKSKTLLSTINKSLDNKELKITAVDLSNTSKNILKEIPCMDIACDKANISTENVETPVRLKSKSRSKTKISPINSISNITTTPEDNVSGLTMNSENNDNNIRKSKITKKTSPKELTKECIVVLQKKMFKQELNNKLLIEKESTPHILFDSDSDDVPLVNLNNNNTSNVIAVVQNEEDEFISKPEIKTFDNIPQQKLKSPKIVKKKPSSKVVSVKIPTLPISQNSDDDDFVEKKRTILVKKSYAKVVKPQKAKSTGSITQRDIDELKARIEIKKKMLLARSMTEDTRELKDLIKKWQKGCQDALMELMNLMRKQIPDKQDMDYSEMLQALKIPASLVGYDSDNDCFVTPNDEDVVLAKFKNL